MCSVSATARNAGNQLHTELVSRVGSIIAVPSTIARGSRRRLPSYDLLCTRRGTGSTNVARAPFRYVARYGIAYIFQSMRIARAVETHARSLSPFANAAIEGVDARLLTELTPAVARERASRDPVDDDRGHGEHHP